MRTFLMTLALGAGIVGWTASAVRAADEKPATTPSTKPAEKTEVRAARPTRRPTPRSRGQVR
jgi:hypothetical protein